MDSLVDSEIRITVKIFPAGRTRVGRLLHSVQLHVTYQVSVTGEELSTLYTSKWVLLGVQPLMIYKVLHFDERFSAVGAGEGHRSRVKSLVVNEFGLAGKPFVTFRTSEWFLRSVNFLMAAEVRAGEETFPALGAGKRALYNVNFAVNSEIGRFGEALPALFATIVLLPGMNLLMSRKIQMAEERFPALGAGVKLPKHVDFFVGGKS